MRMNHPLLPVINQRIVEYNDAGHLLMKDPVECRNDDQDDDFHKLQQPIENMKTIFVLVFAMAALAVVVAIVQRLRLTKFWSWITNETDATTMTTTTTTTDTHTTTTTTRIDGENKRNSFDDGNYDDDNDDYDEKIRKSNVVVDIGKRGRKRRNGRVSPIKMEIKY